MTTMRQVDSPASEQTLIRLDSDQGGADWLIGPASAPVARQLIELMDAWWGSGMASISSLAELATERAAAPPAERASTHRLTRRSSERGFARLVIEWGIGGWIDQAPIPSSLADLVGRGWLDRLAADRAIDELVIEPPAAS